MMIWGVLAYLTAILGTLASTYYDLKTTYIPDKLTHSMILIGILLLFLRYSLSAALTYLGIGVIVFAIGFIVYSLGQIGGGDVKLYTAITMLIPTFDSLIKTPAPPYPPIVSIFFVSALIGVFAISTKYLGKVYKDREKINGFNVKMASSLGVFAFIMALGLLFMRIVGVQSFVLMFPLAIGLALYPFKEDIILLYVLEKKPISKITEDDIIATEYLDEQTKIKIGLDIRKTYLTSELEKMMSNAKKAGVNMLPVYENLPTFGVYILLGLIVTLVCGDLLYCLLTV